jgi:drug/metabolite transporter (DMT)-like permease
MKNQRKAYLFALLAILCWSTIGSAFKISLRYAGYVELLLIASVTATAVHFTTLALGRQVRLLAGLTGKDVLNSAVMGLLNPFLYYVVLLQAYDILPAQEAGTLNYIWPLALVLLSIPLLKQKIRLTSIFAILVSFAGILIISTHGDLQGLRFAHPLGVALALGSALFWALYWIMNLRDRRDAVAKIFLNFAIGTVYVLAYSIFRGDCVIPGWKGIAGGVYLGLFEMGIPFVLWLKALDYSATTAKVSNLIYLSPFISLVLIRVFVGEAILWSTVAGLVFIVAGIIWQTFLRTSR